MDTVLVTYETMSGSTAEVAGFIGDQIGAKGRSVEVLALDKVCELDQYQAIVLGAPMAVGWHDAAIEFLEKHRQAIQDKPLAIFAMAMCLTWTGETSLQGIPVCVDEKLARRPKKVGRLSMKESYSSVGNYAAPILKAAGPARPVSLAFFGGRLEYARLKLEARLFVRYVVGAQEGDRRNWELIGSWARALPLRE
jgi:menaquinone-dependent protoporphyrinogen oxidase